MKNKETHVRVSAIGYANRYNFKYDRPYRLLMPCPRHTVQGFKVGCVKNDAGEFQNIVIRANDSWPVEIF